jgi:hypothetical protein
VCELVGLRIVLIVEADRVGQGLDVGLVAGKEVPAVRGARAVVALEVCLFLGGGDLDGVLGIEADADHFELLAGVEGEHAEGALESAQDLRAEHRAAVVDEREDDGLLGLEEGGERDVAAELVVEGEVERDLLIELLVDTDAFEGVRELEIEVAVLDVAGLLHRGRLAGLGQSERGG